MEQPQQVTCSRENEKIFKEVSNVSGTDDDILVVGYDDEGKDHDIMLQRVLLVC